MKCININNKEYKDLLKDSGLKSLILQFKISKWQEETGLDRFPSKDEIMSFNEVSYNLKAVDILSSDKALEVFKKGKKNGWDLNKILTELQIPKAQKQIILDKNISDREEIITSLLAENSFVVEVNTAKKGEQRYDEVQNRIIQNEDSDKPSNYYQQLTVPGGTNYTENEISTPDIIPNIKGHAQFSTDNGIGWFRSDDKVSNFKESYKGELNNVPSDILEEQGYLSTKTRRILEVQSDLFQKGRDKKDLIEVKGEKDIYYKHEDTGKIVNGQDLIDNYSDEERIKYIKTDSKAASNQFLQLLNKKGNWDNFFIQSIVQDSVKKGYEKVLFPTGDTAAKVEGHQTIEEFIVEKENRIEKLEQQNDDYFSNEYDIIQDSLPDEITESSYIKSRLKSVNQEIEQLQDEIDSVQEQGFEALAPIHTFYQSKVTNILNKLYKVNKITDEHGNTWNEVDLSQHKVNEPIILKKVADLIDENAADIFISEDINDESKSNTSSITKNILFNGKMGKFTAQEILNNIKNNLDLLEGDTKVLESIISYLGKSKSKVRFAYKDELNGAVMAYDASTNTIIIDRDNFDKYNSRYIIESFLHEALHSVTVHSLLNPHHSIDNKIFSDFMNKSFQYYKNLSKEKDRYGFENVSEFVAEVFTNPSFANHIKSLDKLKNIKKGFFAKLIIKLRSILGLNPSYDKVIKSIIKTASTSENQITMNSRLFNKETEGNPFIETDTPLQKYDRIIDKINEGLKTNIRSLQHKAKITRHSDEDKADAIDNYVETLTMTLDLINEKKDVDKILTINTFAKSLNASLRNINKKISQIDYDNHSDAKYTYDTYLKYLTTFDSISELKKLLNELEQNQDESIITKEELQNIKSIINNASSNYQTLENKMSVVAKGIVFNMINDIKYHPEIETIHINRLNKEHKESKIIKDRNSWVIDMMNNRDKELIEKDVNDKSKSLIESALFDLYPIDTALTSPINISAPMIQIINQMFFEIDNERYSVESRKDNEFKRLFEKLVKEKGTNNITELYKNILVKDSSGKYYLKGEHDIKFLYEVQHKLDNIRKKFNEESDKIREELKIISDIKGFSSTEYSLKSKELSKLTDKFNTSTDKLISENTHEEGGKKVINNSWKYNDTLTPVEKEVLNFFIELSEENNKYFYGSDNLIKYSFGAKFYELPKITKSTVERVWTKNEKGIRGYFNDLNAESKNIRPDDFGYVEANTNLKGEKINKLRAHYRGNIENNNQSLDLMTIMRLDYKNANAHNIRREREGDFNLLLDVVKSGKFYERKGTRHIIRKQDGKLNEIDGSASNTIKFMSSMIETKLYDILNHTGSKFGKRDANKIAGFITNASSFLTLSLNVASGTANVVNSNAQLFLLSFIKGKHIKAKSIAKANKIYFSTIGSSMRDITNPIDRSFVNQINEMFNTNGKFNLSDGNFMQSDIIKKTLTTKSLQIFQDSGEHWMQSVITMSTLDGIKVMNEEHNYIDKKGNVVKTESEAASLLEMMSLNKQNGLLEIDKKVSYTTHNKLTSFEDGGKSKIDMLIDKMLKDTIGNYKEMDQPELSKHWYGKLFLQFRKYFVSMGQARLRGIEHSNINKEDMTDEHKRYSYALQDYNEGTYTTTLRFILSAIKAKKLEVLSANWNELSLTEKLNIKKSITELVMTGILLPLLAKFSAALASDDDNEYLFFLAYQLQRLTTELSAYRSVSEMFKMLRSPLPSARLLETTGTIVSNVLIPVSLDIDKNNNINIDFTLNNEDSEGNNKFIKMLNKNNPFYKMLNRNYQDLHTFQTSTWGTGL